ncbi:MAG TPA: sulfurtransferase TusA family protein [Chloroflexota bacterium]|nr:sulfurtransferase TusA family protein [Chloroflexota bacterium]
MAALEALAELPPGAVLEVITDCPQSVNSIPLEAPRHGYELLAQHQDGPTLRFYIRVPDRA